MCMCGCVCVCVCVRVCMHTCAPVESHTLSFPAMPDCYHIQNMNADTCIFRPTRVHMYHKVIFRILED